MPSTKVNYDIVEAPDTSHILNHVGEDISQHHFLARLLGSVKLGLEIFEVDVDC